MHFFSQEHDLLKLSLFFHHPQFSRIFRSNLGFRRENFSPHCEAHKIPIYRFPLNFYMPPASIEAPSKKLGLFYASFLLFFTKNIFSSVFSRAKWSQEWRKLPLLLSFFPWSFSRDSSCWISSTSYATRFGKTDLSDFSDTSTRKEHIPFSARKPGKVTGSRIHSYLQI